MTPERWRQVTSLFYAAQARDATAQRAFLQDACGTDTSLRAEVEELLSAQRNASSMGSGSLFADTLPQLTPGTPFGQYRLEALIGAGGMGQVYRATDTRLRRQVAIKLLLPGLSVTSDFAARFEREGHLLASLNHPNIAAIYGVEETEGLHGLVLELVDGPTLAERLSRGKLSISETLTITSQIASALDAAHERGIIHRDLKPANIKITPTGVVKVLDFGIARVGRTGELSATAAGTRTGLILGTPAYMSPEQARGLAIDKRTDVWAFGCVLYEMLTGRAAFAGETASDTIAHLLEREPAVDALPAGLPPTIRRLVVRCLAKDPSARLRDIADARLEITDALSAPTAAPQTTIPTGRRRWLWLAAGVAVAVAATAVVENLARGRSDSVVGTPMEFPIDLPPEAANAGFGLAVSPDGRRVAFAVCCGGPQLWVHSLDSSETRALPGTEGAFEPFWSPDGAAVGFFVGGKLERTDLAGGPPLDVVEVPAYGGGGTWNANGVILLGSASGNGKFFRVQASGGRAVPVDVMDDAGEALRAFPEFLSDNTHFIYTATRAGRRTTYLASLDSPTATRLVESDYPAVYAAPSTLLFVRGTALVAQSLNLKTGRLEGPVSLMERDAASGSVCDLFFLCPPSFSASANGVLALIKTGGGSPGHLVWFDRTGRTLTAVDQPAGVENLNPAVSPDGQLVAVNRMDPETGNWDLWTIDVTRGNASRITSNPARDTDPKWSPDGKELAFVSNRGGSLAIYKTAVDHSGAEQRLLQFNERTFGVVVSDWSSKFILYQVSTREHPQWSVWALPLFGDQKPISVVEGNASAYAARLSPDGRWIAYQSLETREFEVYIERFPGPGEKRPISRGGGIHPRWTRDGRELVYLAGNAGVGGAVAVDLEFTASGVRVGPRRTLVSVPVPNLIDSRTHYDVTRDGERLLVRQPAGPQRPAITMIVNWMARANK